MKHAPTPEQQAWLERMKDIRDEQRKGSTGSQCRDCKHILGHGHSKTLFYCAMRKLAPTKRTNTCEKFEKP